LEQPHTSAGRVPTDEGYRFYVEYLIGRGVGYESSLAERIYENLSNHIDDMDDLLQGTTKALADISHCISMALAPGPEGTTLRRIEMVPYKNDRIAVVILTDEGIIRHQIISNPYHLKEQDLQRICRFINKEFAGLTLKEIREILLKEMLQDKREFDTLLDRALRLCREAVKEYDANVFIQGVGDILDMPEFEDIQKLRQLYKTIEDKRNVIKLLDEIVDAEGVQVIIGSENPVSEMQSMSVVAASFKDKGKPKGVIGIIGPKRMDYESVISLVDTASRVLTKLIEERRG
ncbi:MAG: heat-inducible transcription repressor HrcA, partial [Nitrospirae bacterium]